MSFLRDAALASLLLALTGCSMEPGGGSPEEALDHGGKADESACLFETDYFFAEITLDDSERPVRQTALVGLRSGDSVDAMQLSRIRIAIGSEVASLDEALAHVKRDVIYVSELEAQDQRRFTTVTFQNDGGRTFDTAGYEVKGAIFAEGTLDVVARVEHTLISQCTAAPIAWGCRGPAERLASILASRNDDRNVQIAPLEWRAGREVYRANAENTFGSSTSYQVNIATGSDGQCVAIGALDDLRNESSLIDDGRAPDGAPETVCAEAASRVVEALEAINDHDVDIERVEIVSRDRVDTLRLVAADGATYLALTHSYREGQCSVDGVQAQVQGKTVDLRTYRR